MSSIDYKYVNGKLKRKNFIIRFLNKRPLYTLNREIRRTLRQKSFVHKYWGFLVTIRIAIRRIKDKFFCGRKSWQIKPKYTEEQYKSYRKSWDDLGLGIVPKNFPLHVDLELSSACDSRCEFCPITPNNELKPKDSIFPTGFMSEKLFKKVVDECEGKASSIKLNWRGEATLHPKFNEFIDYIMQKDFIEVMINTHGNYPPKKRDAQVLSAPLTVNASVL